MWWANGMWLSVGWYLVGAINTWVSGRSRPVPAWTYQRWRRESFVDYWIIFLYSYIPIFIFPYYYIILYSISPVYSCIPYDLYTLYSLPSTLVCPLYSCLSSLLPSILSTLTLTLTLFFPSPLPSLSTLIALSPLSLVSLLPLFSLPSLQVRDRVLICACLSSDWVLTPRFFL